MSAPTLRLVDCLWARGLAEYRSGNHSSARPLFHRLLGLEGVPAAVTEEACENLAEMLRRRGDYAQARRHVQAGLAAQPESAALHHLLATLHEEDVEAGNFKLALRHRRLAVKHGPKELNYRVALGNALLADGQTERGLRCLERAAALEEKEESLTALRAYALALVEEGYGVQARRAVLVARFRPSGSSPAYQRLWDDVRFAAARRKQERRQWNEGTRFTLPLLMPVRQEPRPRKETRKDGAILRMDAPSSAKPHLPRPPARLGKGQG